MTHWSPQRSEVLHSATLSTHRPLARSQRLPSQSESLVHWTQEGEEPGVGEPHLSPSGQQLQEVPAQLDWEEQAWQALSTQTLPRPQWAFLVHSRHSRRSGSQ